MRRISPPLLRCSIAISSLIVCGALHAQDTTVVRLGDNINDQLAGYTYAPAITDDGLTLYFVSDRRGGLGGHDIWGATKERARDTLFTHVFNLGSHINDRSSEGAVSITGDGRTIYFSGCNRADGKGDCDIYESHFDGEEWSPGRDVTELNTLFWDSQPSISADGNAIYFISNRGGMTGGEDPDIYFSTKGSDGTWESPQRMPPPITTPATEDSPYIAPDSSLYFSSNRSGGLGGLDFYVSKQNPDGSWGEARNLGAPLNSSRDERFITMAPSADVIYFSSTRNVGGRSKLSLYMALLPPSGVILHVAGRVYDRPSGRALSSGLMLVDSASGRAIGGAVSDSAGGYSIEVNLHHPVSAILYGTVEDFGPVRRDLRLSPSGAPADARADFALGREDESSLLPDVRLMLNPTAHTLGVDCSSGKYESGKKRLVIENSRGDDVAVADFSADHVTLDISDLSPGAYMAKIGDVFTAFVVSK